MIPFMHALGNDLGAFYLIVIKIAPVRGFGFQSDTARAVFTAARDRSVSLLILHPDFVLSVFVFAVIQAYLLPRKGRQRVSADILKEDFFPLCAVAAQIRRFFPAV